MYALKFISGKYQGGEFPLKPEKQVIIGRSSDLDMVLVEDMVSRKHAKITCASGKILIEDLVKISAPVSLGIVVVAFVIGITLSLAADKRDERAD